MELKDVVEVLKAWAYLTENKHLYAMLSGGETVEGYLDIVEKEAKEQIDGYVKEIEKLKEVIKTTDKLDLEHHRSIGKKEALEGWCGIGSEKDFLKRVEQYRKMRKEVKSSG